MRSRLRTGVTMSAAIALSVASLVVASPAARADDSHALIQGSGSSWAANAVNQWIADTTQSGLQVVYTSNGSTTGRTDFANNVTDYADSDVAYGQTTDPSSGTTDSSSRNYSYLPVVAGGTSFPYQVREAGNLVRNIRLSGLTLAKIFTNQITNWNDPAITSDNNGRALPSLDIVPVVRSDGSGATAQFTLYLADQFPQLWSAYAHQSGGTSFWPTQGNQIPQNGSDQVINYLTSSAANGAIAYDEYSYALQKNYPVINLENASHHFAQPTQYNVAVALQQAQIDTADVNDPTKYLTQQLHGVYSDTDPRAYPMSSYSYFIIPTSSSDTRMTTAKRQTIADYLYYSLCQGQREAGPLGYSPLPENLVQASFDQVGKLKGADSGVDLSSRDISTCNNPTFDPGNPNGNKLAQIAPQPQACDQVGAGPCGATNAAAVNANPTGSAAPGSGGSSPAAAGPPDAASAQAGAPASGGTARTGTTARSSTTGTAARAGAAGTGTVVTGGSAPGAATALLSGSAVAGSSTTRTSRSTTVDPVTGRVVAATGSLAGDGSGAASGTDGAASTDTSGAPASSSDGSSDVSDSLQPAALGEEQNARTPLEILAAILVLAVVIAPAVVSGRLRARAGSGS